MREKDKVEQNISPANRCASTADGGNLLQNNSVARMNEIDRERCGHYFPMVPSGGDFRQEMREYRDRHEFKEHFRMPGGMTFAKGDILPEDRDK